MIGSCLAGKFWAGAIFNAAEIVNMQYRVDFRISPRESLHWTKPDVNLAIWHRVLYLCEGRTVSEQKIQHFWRTCHLLWVIDHR